MYPAPAVPASSRRRRRGGLGQPAIDPLVLSMEISPQHSESWAAWVDYWWQRMRQSATISDITRTASLALNDLIQQGASDEMVLNVPGQPVGFAHGVLAALANTAARNIGYTPGGATSEAVRTQGAAPETSLEYAPTIARSAQNIRVWTDALINMRNALAMLLAQDQGDPAVAARITTARDEIARLTAMLGSDLPPELAAPVVGSSRSKVIADVVSVPGQGDDPVLMATGYTRPQRDILEEGGALARPAASWMWLAGGAAALFALTRKRRR